MKWFQLFTLLAIQLWISEATKILYVSPDNSTNVSCPFQPCAKLSQYLLDNGTLSVVSNVQYYFLPGEHHVPINMMLQDLCNFSIIGTVKESPPPVLLVSYVISVTNSYNVTIANVVFRRYRCDQMQLNEHKYLTKLLIDSCYSCTLENVLLINMGLIGANLFGNSHLTKIMIKLHVLEQKLLVLCQGITLDYWAETAYKNHKHILTMNQINIVGEGAGNKCHSTDPVGIHIIINIITDLIIVLNNSLFRGLHYTAIKVRNRCNGNNTIIIENCTFEHNGYKYNSEDFMVPLRPLVDIVVAHNYKSIFFKQCSFQNNYNNRYLISILVWATKLCYHGRTPCIGHLTNITFVSCQFTNNLSKLMNIIAHFCTANLFIIGPSHIVHTMVQSRIYYDVISVSKLVVHLVGPVILSYNKAGSIMHFESCKVLFYNNIIIKSNNCNQVIALQFTYITVMEYTNITLFKNRHHQKLIETEYDKKHKLYPLCIFQFATLKNKTFTSPVTTHYSINIIDNKHYRNHQSANMQIEKKCIFPLYYFTPHCRWVPNAAFHNYNPEVIHQQIIKIKGENLTYHKICHCFQNGSYDCNIDTLGPVYPGQTLQAELCTPCDNEPSALYPEVSGVHLPDSACKVASYTETNVIYDHYSIVSFTIVSEAADVCELFITTTVNYNYISEAFYVQLLSCPTGFTLQNGVCKCDPIFSTYTVECYIDDSAIKHSANTWITAHTQTNSTNYLISDCPMDYCLPYSSKLNLLHPDLQCQFNRSGILCSQCQYHLSMVFGSSRCMECTNLNTVIISFIVIVAGVVLVVSLYLLNLTVTNGTISGIIFYANIVSINDSVFLVNDNVFNPLKVFISFVNLDLGIETCFYNGMDSYAKVWLQLFFPLYLLVIAVSVIMASRYSPKLLRLTYSRSLPVLATLFLLSFTGVLRVVLTVLFSYSTITHLPTGHQQLVWSIDASIPLFGVKFTILFITCLVLFLLLIPFNITLLLTRYLRRFRLINYYKPLLDAFQGSYKDKYYYWVGLQIAMRSLFFAMYAFQTRLKLILSTILLIIFGFYSCCIFPHKNKLVNAQEIFLLVNLTIMYAVSYQNSENTFSIVTNITISLAFIQLFTIILYHLLMYTCHCNVAIALKILKGKVLKLCHKNQFKHKSKFKVELLNIPKCTYNYAEYRDGLVSDDFK